MLPSADHTSTEKKDSATEPQCVRVMLVDDSAVIRGLLTRILTAEPDIEVTASVSNGELAVSKLKSQDVDVIVLDIEMPVMDGLEALPLLLKIKPNIKIIMASTLTMRNAGISMRALEMGAAEYIPKPTSSSAIHKDGEFNVELIGKVRSLGKAARKSAGLVTSNKSAVAAPEIKKSLYKKEIVLRNQQTVQKPELLAIGSSTGGPQALLSLLKEISSEITYPVLITQHMPATFTKILAEHISDATGKPCTEGADGDVIVSGRLYLAPGGYHMTVKTSGTQKVIQLNQDPPENFCRPAVDAMLRSIKNVYGTRVLTVILTGMGTDGCKEATKLSDAGGTIIAQDEESSVVWGMPGAVATAGICSAVLPLKEIGSYIKNFMVRGSA